MDLNKYFAIIPESKKDELSFDIEQIKIKDIFDFNELNFIDIISTKKHLPNKNLIEKDTLIYLNYSIENTNQNLIFVVPINISKMNYLYDIFHPYSMRQAHYLHTIGIEYDILTTLYRFTQNEITKGYAIRDGIKEEFYPLALENGKTGTFYFSKEILGLPEFLSTDALNKIK